MNGIDKLKSRTEWQAFLLTMLTLFLNHFLGWEMSSDTLLAMVGSSGAYGISRGMAKGSADPDASGQSDGGGDAA